MAYTQADLDLLQSNMAKGVKTAMLDGEMVTFRSLDEMERTEAKIQRYLKSGNKPRSRKHTPITSTGW